jgi:GNAT superfamily N-acetyltransferase
MHIEKVEEITDEIFNAILELIPHLGSSQPNLPKREEIVSLVKSESSTLWLARYPDQNGEIAGILTLAVYRIPTGLRSIIEDVIVDPGFRRRGIARTLLQSAINFAREAGANGVALTSSPKRVAANLLYQFYGVRAARNQFLFLWAIK